MDDTQSKSNNINSINRAFMILRLFSESWELGIQDISRLTGLNKTTVFRVVKSLEANRMLGQNHQTDKYYPDVGVLELAHNIYANYDVKYVFQPYMNRLLEEFNEDVILSTLSGTTAVCIERFRSNNVMALYSNVGRALPVYGGSTARVFLPYLDEDARSHVYQELQQARELARPVSVEDLEESMDFIQKNGYMMSCGVMDRNVFSVSVPVKVDDSHIYSLGICGLKERMYSKGVDHIAERLLDYGKQISDKLVYCDVIL